MSSSVADTAVFALENLLVYAKYLEDHGTLTYDLLKARVDSYRQSDVADDE